MTFLTTLALTLTLVTLLGGGVTLLAERGYPFDLRRARRRKDPRAGGRRESDRLATAAK